MKTCIHFCQCCNTEANNNKNSFSWLALAGVRLRVAVGLRKKRMWGSGDSLFQVTLLRNVAMKKTGTISWRKTGERQKLQRSLLVFDFHFKDGRYKYMFEYWWSECLQKALNPPVDWENVILFSPVNTVFECYMPSSLLGTSSVKMKKMAHKPALKDCNF